MMRKISKHNAEKYFIIYIQNFTPFGLSGCTKNGPNYIHSGYVLQLSFVFPSVALEG